MDARIIELRPGTTVAVFAKDDSVKWDSRDDRKTERAPVEKENVR